MFRVITSTGHDCTTFAEKIAREFYTAAKRSGRGAVLTKDGVVIAECDVFSA